MTRKSKSKSRIEIIAETTAALVLPEELHGTTKFHMAIGSIHEAIRQGCAVKEEESYKRGLSDAEKALKNLKSSYQQPF